MTYRIENIELFIRKMPAPRVDFRIGKGMSLFPPILRSVLTTRLLLSDSRGRTTFGCSEDWLAVGWLDKRSELLTEEKLRDLLDLVVLARDVYLESVDFVSPFDLWLDAHGRISSSSRERDGVDICVAFASAQIERAVVDAVCRIEGHSVFDMVRKGNLGFRPERVHPELDGLRLEETLSEKPRTRFHVRHTVSLKDALKLTDVPPGDLIGDGEPESLDQIIEQLGVSYFKVKVSGGQAETIARLERIWRLVKSTVRDPWISLDGNEAFLSVGELEEFVQRLKVDHPAFFKRILFIEQPLPRDLTFDSDTTTLIKELAALKPLVIDEADGELDSFRRALEIGYRGVSHKNCKGFFKSLLNHSLCAKRTADGDGECFMSAEDLTNMPLVALHQDFATLGILGLAHVERNGHHFFPGLSHLSAKETESAAEHHTDLYARGAVRWFMNIENGEVDCRSLQCPGMGVRDEPDWGALEPLDVWRKSQRLLD
jgi:hypothetical protein